MVFKSEKGMFEVQRNYRNAFNKELFVEKYIDEYFDKYPYLVGDISNGLLRIKGFVDDPHNKDYYGNIDKYLDISCAFGCPFYVLKRINSNDEYNRLEGTSQILEEEPRLLLRDTKKENFDREALILSTNPSKKPRIELNMKIINEVPIGVLPPELKEKASPNKANNSFNKKKEEKPPFYESGSDVDVQTYVSASPDFDPSKKKNPPKRFNNNNINNQKKENKNFNNKFNKGHNKNQGGKFHGRRDKKDQ
jgi:uncharacterized protein YutD